MKKTLAISLIMILSATFCAFADEGEIAPQEEAPANVAPAIIQAPPASTPVSATKSSEAPAQAEEPRTGKVIKHTTLRTEDCESVTGSVVSILPSSLSRPRSRIVIADQQGSQIEFVVKTLAVTYDPTGCIMALDKIQQLTKVQINYRTSSDNVKVATSIKVLQ